MALASLLIALPVAGCGTSNDSSGDDGTSSSSGSAAQQQAGFDTVTIEDVADSIEAGTSLLVDVRTQQEWNAGHAARATLVPFDTVASSLDEITAEADGRPIVFICRSGNRSAQAAQVAVDAGVTDVSSVDGGMQAWVDAGLPILPKDGSVA
ncbi:MAG: rhodanese-like domain-containing protein [Thermoleophilia bacterium]|nr:rhodanese-like domain-containing protein [Thermoleophilia bacterium]